MKNLGKIFFFSGPSGVGKGTLIHALRDRHPDWVFPASFTTRQPRPDEIDGETYHFIDHAEFRRKILADDFLEYAEVHGGNLYGTDKEKLLEPLKKGKIVIREFDVQGFIAAREKLKRSEFHGIFIRPAGGIDELVRRIKERAPISRQELERRIESMGNEFKCAHLYDDQIFSENGNIDKLIADAEDFIAQAPR